MKYSFRNLTQNKIKINSKFQKITSLELFLRKIEISLSKFNKSIKVIHSHSRSKIQKKV